MDWKKYISREFLIALAAIIIATFALFKQPVAVSFLEWAGSVGGFVALFAGTQTYQKVKANGKQ